MTGAAWLQLGFLIALLAISTPLLGAYMAKIYGGGRAPGDRIFLPVEGLIYRICRVDPDREQRWTVYAYSMLAFSFVTGVVLYAQLRLQGHLPLNPDHMKAVPAGLSFNTAHDAEHYGNVVTYLRAKGLVPPSSQPAGK